MQNTDETIEIVVTDEKYPLKSIDKKRPGKQRLVNKAGKLLKVVTVCGKSLTEQSHRKDCDMNHILREYQKTGMIRHAKKYAGEYDDVTVESFQDAMFLVTRAQQMFNDLPSSLRKEFNNDPAQFVEFTGNPANKDRMIELGIIGGNDGLRASGAPSGAPTSSPAEPAQAAEEPPPAT